MKVPKPLRNLTIFLFIVIGLYFTSEMYSYMTIKGRDPSDIGYVVFHHGTSYFVKGENLTETDLKSFSDKGNFRSNKIEEVAILDDISIKRGFKNGDKVAIWYNEILESHPAQIKLMYIE